MKVYPKKLSLLRRQLFKFAKSNVKNLFVLSCLILATTFKTFAQDFVSGTVKDEKGEPLVGVSVICKEGGKTISGTTSDIDGHYRIQAMPTAQIEFSYVGFKTMKIQISSKKNINVILESDDKLLQEVVVVGYGTQKKVNLTGSIAQVTSETLQDRPTNSVAQMIQGSMPNVGIKINTGSPGSGGDLTIRGVGSINSSSPLIMVDGVPGDLDQLNPSDIESISVLKDASSAAIYGARAAFGVVLITTKKAKSGKPRISYDTYFASSTPTVSTDFVTSGYEHALVYDTSYKSVGSSATGYTEEDYRELEARRYDLTEHPDRPWVMITTDNTGREKYNYYANFDWWNWIYKNHMMSQSHNLNLSGGTDKVQYYISGSFYTKEGLMKRVNEDYSQYTLNSKIDAELSKWLKVSNYTTYFEKAHSYPGENAANAAFARTMINSAPYYVPIGPDGNYTGVMKNGKILNEARIADIHGGVSKGNVGFRRFRNTFAAEILPINNLAIKFDYTFGFTMDDNWKRQGLVYVSTGYANELTLSSTTIHKADYLQKSVSFNPSHNINAYATYNNTFGENYISAIVGVNYEKQQYSNLLGYRSDVMSESLNDLDLATGSEIKALGGSSAYQLFGTFFRTEYNYKEKYLFEINGRYDGSSRFLQGNRFGFFPSVSAAWRLSEESFINNIDVFENLKLRTSYGVLGNQLGVSTYPYSTINQQLSTTHIVNNALVYYLTSPQPIAGDYTWEKVKTFNVGLDVSVLNNRLSLEYDYFIRNTTDMFVDGVTLPAVYGTDPPRQNAGEMRTNGYEIVLGWRDRFNLSKNPFTYQVFASLGDATSKITKYQGNDAKILTDYYEGMVLGEIWGFRVDGLFKSDEEATAWTNEIDQTNVNRDIWTGQGEWAVARGGDLKYLDLDQNKKIDRGANTVDDHGDLEIIGNSTPRYNYGFGANLTYAGVDFSINFQGIGQSNLYPNKEMEKFWGSWGRVNSAFLPKGIADLAWTEENTNSYFPRLERGSAAYKDNGQMTVPNDRYLQNLGYLRLKNLSIGYTVPSKYVKKISVDRLRIYAAGENLFYWSPFMTNYIDPEQAMSRDDARIYPFSKTFTIGLNISL